MLHVGHQPLDARRRFDRVGAGQLVHRDNGARLPIQAPYGVIGLSAQLDAGHILDPHGPTIRRFADDDLPELLGRSQTALRAHGVRVFLSLRGRLAAHLPRRVHRVLRLDCADDFRDGDGQLGELVGLDPKPHRILPRAENLDAADARHPRDLVAEIDEGVVGQELCVVGRARRVQADKHEGRGQCFLHRNPVVRDIDRKLRRSQRLAHLGENQIGVRVRLHIEVHNHPHLPVGGGI